MRRSLAVEYGFGLESWAQIENRIDRFGAGHIVELVRNIQAETGPGTLVGSSLMGGSLVVRPLPVPDPPYDVIAVRAPDIGGVPAGSVVIEHLTVTGRNDRIERPISDTIPLFWRFMIEKFGIHPKRDGIQTRNLGL